MDRCSKSHSGTVVGDSDSADICALECSMLAERNGASVQRTMQHTGDVTIGHLLLTAWASLRHMITSRGRYEEYL